MFSVAIYATDIDIYVLNLSTPRIKKPALWLMHHVLFCNGRGSIALYGCMRSGIPLSRADRGSSYLSDVLCTQRARIRWIPAGIFALRGLCTVVPTVPRSGESPSRTSSSVSGSAIDQQDTELPDRKESIRPNACQELRRLGSDRARSRYALRRSLIDRLSSRLYTAVFTATKQHRYARDIDL